MEKETAEKIKFLYDGLQELQQENYRKSLRELTLEEFHIWFDEDKLGNEHGLDCYLKYKYLSDVNGEPVEKFTMVNICPWGWKKVFDEKYKSIYHWEKVNIWKFLFVYSNEKKDAAPFVYPLNSFNNIGLFCDPTYEYYKCPNPNPMLEINKWKEEQNKKKYKKE